MKLTICHACNHPRIHHENPLAISNTGVGKCKDCSCNDYKPNFRELDKNSIVYFGILVGSLILGMILALTFELMLIAFISPLGLVLAVIFILIANNRDIKNEIASQKFQRGM